MVDGRGNRRQGGDQGWIGDIGADRHDVGAGAHLQAVGISQGGVRFEHGVDRLGVRFRRHRNLAQKGIRGVVVEHGRLQRRDAMQGGRFGDDRDGRLDGAFELQHAGGGFGLQLDRGGGGNGFGRRDNAFGQGRLR